MLNDSRYQNIEKIAQDRGVSLDRVAAFMGMPRSELTTLMSRKMTAFSWGKIMNAIQTLSPSKGIIKNVNPYGEFVVEKSGSVVDCSN